MTTGPGRPRRIYSKAVHVRALDSALARLESRSHELDKLVAGEPVSVSEAASVLQEDLHSLGSAADGVRAARCGQDVTFVASYYMNYTNVCAASCQMCAFYRKKGQEGAYTLTPEQIEKRAGAAERMGATEVHIVGGFHPDLPLEYYEDMLRSISARSPSLHVKAFTAAEVFFIARLTGNSVREVLSRLKRAGLGSMPGGGAELFHPDVRGKIVRGKCSGEQWLETVREAHAQGIRSNVTMLYGHIERPEHVADHLIRVRRLQEETGGFITFIPLKFSKDNTDLEREHRVEHECSSLYDLRVVALSRLVLAGALDNVSVYWVAYGKKVAQVALSHGGNDMVGTAFSEEIYRAAGRPAESSIDELAGLIRSAGRRPVQRDTFFRPIRSF